MVELNRFSKLCHIDKNNNKKVVSLRSCPCGVSNKVEVAIPPEKV